MNKRQQMKVFIWLLALVSFSSVRGQCTFVLSGRVLDKDTQESLPYATVYIAETEIGGVADSLGRFEMKGLCKGDVKVVVMHAVCETYAALVHIEGDKTLDFLLPHALNTGEVVVNGKKINPLSTQAQTEIKGLSLLKNNGFSFSQALTQVAGVTTLSTGATIQKPVLHGLHSNRILLLNNGIRQEGQQWGMEHAPEIDAFIAQKITVIKGADAVRYGADAMAGVILVEPQTSRDSAGVWGAVHLGTHTNGRMGAISGNVGQRLSGKFSPFSWQVQGTLKRSGNIRAPRYFLKNTGLAEANFSLATEWQKSDYAIQLFYSRFQSHIGIFSGSHIGNLTDLNLAMSSEFPLDSAGFSYKIDRPRQEIVHDLLKAKMFIRTGNAGRLYITLAHQYNQRSEYDKHKPLNDSIAALNRPELAYTIGSQSGEVVWEHMRWHNFTGSAGFFTMYQHNQTSGRVFIPNYRTFTSGIFAIERWRKNKWEIEAGIRGDYRFTRVFKWVRNTLTMPEYTFQNVSANVGAIYKLNPNLRLNANLGRAWRAPGINELFSDGVHHGAAAVEIGDPNLKPEKLWSAMLTATQVSAHLKGQVSVYYNDFQDFIYLKPVLPPTLTIRGAFPTFYYKQTHAILSGGDYEVSYDFNPHFQLASKGAFLRAWNRTQKEWIVMMPADRMEHTCTWSPGLKGKWNKAYVAGSFLHVLKQTRTPANSDYVSPPNAYQLWNLDVGATYHINPKQEINMGAGVRNLLNTTYRDYMDRFRYFTDEQGRNVTFRISYIFS